MNSIILGEESKFSFLPHRLCFLSLLRISCLCILYSTYFMVKDILRVFRYVFLLFDYLSRHQIILFVDTLEIIVEAGG